MVTGGLVRIVDVRIVGRVKDKNEGGEGDMHARRARVHGIAGVVWVGVGALLLWRR